MFWNNVRRLTELFFRPLFWLLEGKKAVDRNHTTAHYQQFRWEHKHRQELQALSGGPITLGESEENIWVVYIVVYRKSPFLQDLNSNEARKVLRENNVDPFLVFE